MKILRGVAAIKRVLYCGAGSVICISLWLALAGEYEAMLAWWLLIMLLLPPLLWALKTRFVALVTICSLAFASQFITLPLFYLNRDEFAWGHVKPFGFTALEALPMLIKVAVFLYALIIFFGLFYRVSFVGKSSRKLSNRFYKSNTSTNSASNFVTHNNQVNNNFASPHRSSGLYLFLIVLVIVALVPLNLWMFSQGISIVGVEPPHLPYRLSGVLHYFTKYMIPLTLTYLYFKTKRGWLPMLLMLSYAWVLGLSSVSRSSLMFVMLPVLYCAWLDRHQLLLAVAGFGALIGFSFVSTTRNYVYVVSAGKSGVDVDTGVFSIVLSIATNHDSRIWKLTSVLAIIGSIFGRIDGFDNLVMSQYYDPCQVVGPFGMLVDMLWQGLVPVDLDLHHMQWQGNTLIEGFVNGGGLLSNAVILGNAGLWWTILSALVAAVTLVLLEKSTKRLVKLYKMQHMYVTVIIGYLSLSYFIGAAGSIHFVYPLIAICITSWLPPIANLNILSKFERRR